ncbi:Asp23/Gls24 family envelope stress response protein [Yinghuangia sp. ASG 101]|uniref:Asp23/Gls24 family envelope stress response protein n=1 Tax=Yinghuangia sp. ASG 101 TaxID=2896848 RepID=UPI001E5206E5|nr:Asp23/Gls24 family envelope stress response protein [Yinghuangia sp. ASG 101]UGQ09355.1 Asp23/Gls24 family envelope stress response protein [Yinghuangia sp. ASG 101]
MAERPTKSATDSGTTGGSTPATTGHAIQVSALSSERGRTAIADSVVAKISGVAAREVSGVYALGKGVARAFASVRQRVPGGKPNVAQGVSVEVGERQCAVDLTIIVEYGVAISEVAADVRENVIDAVERMTGLEVVEVNISVDDIHIESPDDERTGRTLE